MFSCYQENASGAFFIQGEQASSFQELTKCTPTSQCQRPRRIFPWQTTITSCDGLRHRKHQHSWEHLKEHTCLPRCKVKKGTTASQWKEDAVFCAELHLAYMNPVSAIPWKWSAIGTMIHFLLGAGRFAPKFRQENMAFSGLGNSWERRGLSAGRSMGWGTDTKKRVRDLEGFLWGLGKVKGGNSGVVCADLSQELKGHVAALYTTSIGKQNIVCAGGAMPCLIPSSDALVQIMA